METGVELQYRMENDIGIISIHGEITNENAVHLRKDVVHWVIDHQPKGVVLLLKCSLISSLGIGAVIAIYQDLLDENIKLATCLSDHLTELFIRAKINRILAVFKDEAESVNYLRKEIGQ